MLETDLSNHRFPGIAKATLEMSYANGGINRYRREFDALKALDRVLETGVDVAMDLPAIDEWLSGLSDDDMLTVVDGEETEMLKIVEDAPPGTDSLLNQIFGFPRGVP